MACISLEGKVALITGGTAGIGKSIALRFASHGAKVAIFGTNEERGQAVCAELSKVSGKEDAALFIPVDVSSTKETEVAIQKVQDTFGEISIVVNNAGITKDGLFMKMKEEDWDRVIAVNLKSLYNVCKPLSRAMMKAKKGTIINVSSVVGLTGNAGQVNYSASKAGMIGATKSLAKEFASRGIRVNCIAPGFVKTAMTDALNEKQKQDIYQQIPMSRIGEPEEIAQVALFLASDLSSYITGQVLAVDGGMVM